MQILTHKSKKTLAVIILILGCMLFLAPIKSRLLISKSDSMPHKVYLLVKGKKWQKNNCVAISGFKTKYTKEIHFTKRVVGITGDAIKVSGDKVFVNENLVAILKPQTKNNETLTPIDEQIVPQNSYFVIADHKDSFDSRYQEFGLVKNEYIEGKAYPIW